MTIEELERKSESEGLTVEEVKEYQKFVKPVKHVYGKYGTLAKIYMQEHNWIKMVVLGGDLSEYLHNIDKQADEIYETMYAKLSEDERYKRTGDYLEDVRRINQMKSLIEEEILTELVYVKKLNNKITT